MIKDKSNKSPVTLSPATFKQLEGLSDKQCLYCVLDSCNHPLVLRMAQIRSSQAESLYKNQAAIDFEDFAPYLFEADVTLLKWIEENLVGKHFGIFIESDLDRSELRKHLRKFLMVDGPEDRRLYFRFYDPRVIGGFLVTAKAEDAVRFLAPMKSLLFLNPEEELCRIQLAKSLDGQNASPDQSQKLKVTKDHLAAMADHSKAEFCLRLGEHLSQSLPDKGINLLAGTLESKIKTGMLNAERYSLTTESNIADYVELMCIGFPESTETLDPPEIRQLMLDRRIEIPKRMEKLKEMIAGATTA